LVRRTALKNRVSACIARILALLAFFNFFLYSIDRCVAAAFGHVAGMPYPMNLPSKQTGLAPLRRAFAFLFFFMDNPVFLFSSWHSHLDKCCPCEKRVVSCLRVVF
jgi:hypothetical protein